MSDNEDRQCSVDFVKRGVTAAWEKLCVTLRILVQVFEARVYYRLG